jgi:heme exporter protein D
MYEQIASLPSNEAKEAVTQTLESRLKDLEQREKLLQGDEKQTIRKERSLLETALQTVKTIDPSVWLAIGQIVLPVIVSNIPSQGKLPKVDN